MFKMMNTARLSVGVQGLAVGDRAYQQAVAYAKERVQGRPIGSSGDGPIIEHVDVRRMLLTIKAHLEALRCLLYLNAESIDLAKAHPDEAVRTARGELVELLTPISKGWATELGVELTSLAVQVHGGMGYIEETGVAQHYRDVRIAAIYEGTNGIQAIDLVGRKLGLRGGAVADGFLEAIDATAAEAAAAGGEVALLGERLAEACATLRDGDRLAARSWRRRSQPRPGRGDAVPAHGRPGDRWLAAHEVGARRRHVARRRRRRVLRRFPRAEAGDGALLRHAAAAAGRRPVRRRSPPERPISTPRRFDLQQRQESGAWLDCVC